MNGVLLLGGLAAVLGGSIYLGRPFLVLSQGLLEEVRGIRLALEANSIDNGLQLERRLSAMEEALDRLPSKWEDIKRESKSQYERARHHVRRTKEELETRGLTDPEIDALDRELRLLDGSGGGSERVPAVHEGVDRGPAQVAPAEEDYLTLGNRRKFGA